MKPKLILFLLLYSIKSLSGVFIITNLSPNTGDTIGGYPLLINTNQTLSNATVTINNIPCNVQLTSGMSVVCNVPPGTGSVSVIVTDNSSSTIPDSNNPTAHIFNFKKPDIDSISPKALARTGGQTINISGTNFSTSGSVLIGSGVCQIQNFSENLIQCTSPAGAGTDLTVSVTQNNANTGIQANVVSYEICTLGTFDTGSTCELCPLGTFQDQSGQLTCNACPTGTFSANTGSAACNVCPLGSSQGLTGQTSCNICQAGTFQNLTGQASCTSCPEGTFAATTGALNCSVCAAGTFQNSSGQTACNTCQPGTFQANTGQSSCDTCQAGTFTSNPGSLFCNSCPSGRFQNLTGQATCLDCQPGSFSNFPGASNCTTCPSDSFQSLAGSTSCLTCADGTTQPATGQSQCFSGNVCDALFGISRSSFEAGLIPVFE